jgi:Protein of unknown function (DUF2971)
MHALAMTYQPSELFVDSAEYPSPTLYHYTNALGLIGILTDQTLWATDIEFLNDGEELLFGGQPLYNNLVARSQELRPTDPDSLGRPGAWSAMMNVAGTLSLRLPVGESTLGPWHGAGSRPSQAIYVACFCSDGDLLSQWRGYGSAGGFAIGLDRCALENLAPISGHGPFIDLPHHKQPTAPVEMTLTNVAYGPQEAESLVKHVLTDIEERGGKLTDNYAYSLLAELAKVKSAAFSEEREWRLILVGRPEKLNFRAEPIGVVPYTSIPVGSGIVRNVVVGPGPHMELRQRGVGRLLNRLGWDWRHVGVFPSRAAWYRA